MTLQFIFYANGFQTTTNTGLLQFSTAQTNIIIPINTRHYGSSSPDNATPHADVLNSEPIFCDPAVEVGGRRQAKEVTQCQTRSISKKTGNSKHFSGSISYLCVNWFSLKQSGDTISELCRRRSVSIAIPATFCPDAALSVFLDTKHGCRGRQT